MSSRRCRSSERWSALLLLALGGALACRKGEPPGAGARSAEARRSGPESAASAFLRAELRRDPSAVGEDDLHAPSAARRALSVRTLARIGDERSFTALLEALGDEAPEVIGWAAFGVGQACSGHEPDSVRRLVLRAASLSTQDPAAERDEALLAIALALGRCGSDDAERSLRSWLGLRREVSEAAALGLGQLARGRKRLDDATVAQLLDESARQSRSLYLYPLESVAALGAAARARLLEVGKLLLESNDAQRAFAIRALSKAGVEAAPELRALVESDAATDTERADAARSLAALGGGAQVELGRALGARARRLLDGNAWLSPEHGVVLTLLDGLEPKHVDAALLTELSQLPLTGEPAPVVRRKVMLRCRAAGLLAGRASLSPALLACDPAPAAERRQGSLAILRVLARAPLVGERARRFQELLDSTDRVVREAALELLMAHDEAPDISSALANALGAKEAGVRATAAQVLARYPARAQQAPKAAGAADASATPPLDPRVVQALGNQLSTVMLSSNIELSSLLLDAAVALELLGAKPVLEQACASSNPTLRQHAERGLSRLGDAQRRCNNVPDSAQLKDARALAVTLELETDSGSLRLALWGEKQPLAVGRLVELARSGFYDGMVIHRVVPGFVVQFGDPDGDGFGGTDLPPLRCQLGPEPFEAGSVGVALAGRDTGSSQFFVALRRAPHLDGEYSLIGRAEPGWERLAEGDRILKLRVLEASP